MPFNHFSTGCSPLCGVEELYGRKSSKLADFILRQKLTQVVDLNGERLRKLQYLGARCGLPIYSKRAFVAITFDRPSHDRVLTKTGSSCELDLNFSFPATVLHEFAGVLGPSQVLEHKTSYQYSSFHIHPVSLLV